MMMIVMLSGGKRSRCHAGRSWSFRFLGWGTLLGHAADGAEPVLRGILTAAGKAGASLRGFRQGAHRCVRIHLRSQPLNRLQSGGNGFVAGLGLQVLLQTPE
jgi:hypothetical protein